MRSNPVRYRFGQFTLLPVDRRLVADCQDIHLGARAFDVLVALVERSGQLATKEVLIDRAWSGLVVEEANLHVQVSQLRKIIGAEAIATVPGLGYRFAIPVNEPEPRPAVSPRRLSVLVMPFVESGASPEQDCFSDAVTDDITTQLSKIRGSYVIYSPAALASRREKLEVGRFARARGVRYVLQGRIERSDANVEINLRLSDTATDAVVWSDVINVPKAGLSDLRHEVGARLANALSIHLFAAEAQRIKCDQLEDPDADELVMRARCISGLVWPACDPLRALELLDQALRIDPNHVEGLTWRAACLVNHAAYWPGPEIATQIARAEADLAKALSLDSFDCLAHETLSHVRHLQYRDDVAVIDAETALELDPCAARSHAWRGALHMYVGHCEETPGPVRRALALSPRDPQRWSWLLFLGMACLLEGDRKGAVKWLEQSLSVLPSFWVSRLWLVSAYAQLGQIDHARFLRKGLGGKAKIHSKWSRVTDNPRFMAQMREHYFEGLIKCGVTTAQSADEWVDGQRRNAEAAHLSMRSVAPLL